MRWPAPKAKPKTLGSLRPLMKSDLEQSLVAWRDPSLASRSFLPCPSPDSLVYSLRLEPFVFYSPAFLCRDYPAYCEPTNGSLNSGQPGP